MVPITSSTGRVLGLIDGLGDDHSDHLANKARLIVRHRRRPAHKPDMP
jgi:hypothetical protein